MYFVRHDPVTNLVFFFFGSEPKTIDQVGAGGGGGRSEKSARFVEAVCTHQATPPEVVV